MAIVDSVSGIKQSRVFSIDPAARADDLGCEISMKLMHLKAMTSVVCGEGFESFNNKNDVLMENYLWALSHQIGEVQALFSAYSARAGNRSFKEVS